MAKTPSSPVLFNFEDMESQAQAYLQHVREEAQKLVSEAQNQAQDIREKAREDGFRDGFQAGIEHAEETCRQGIHSAVETWVSQNSGITQECARNVVQNLQNVRGKLVAVWESGFLELVAALVRKIVRGALETSPDITLAWVREALELCAGENRLTLRLNPDDLEILHDPLGKLRAEFHQLGELTIREDSALQRGDCVVDTEFGQLDQRLDSQIRRLLEDIT